MEIDSNTTVSIINETEFEDSKVMKALAQQHPEFAALRTWRTQSTQRNGGVFERDRYTAPDRMFDVFKTAKYAAEFDDIVSNSIDTTEALALNRVEVECDDVDENDLWDQILEGMSITPRVKAMWRELETISQCYVAVHRERKTFRVNGRTAKGNAKKKTYDLLVPTNLTILNPLKVIPITSGFGNETLVYVAEVQEAMKFREVLNGTRNDKVVQNLIADEFRGSPSLRAEFQQMTGVSDMTYLFVLNPKNVFRITETRPDYQPFADVRMKAVFELLDLKAQLKELDRTLLMGATNYILLMKKGSKEEPALPTELANLSAKSMASSRIPVIVSDHRLDIEIITPKTDHSLEPSRYNLLNATIAARMYNVIQIGFSSSSGARDDTIKLLRLISKSLESKRRNIGQRLLEEVIMPCFRDNNALSATPRMKYWPDSISMDFDPALMSALEVGRQQGDVSRETFLARLGLDQTDEVARREREAIYDHVFVPPAVPFSGNTGAPSVDGGPNAAPTGKAAGKALGGSNPASHKPSPSKSDTQGS